ncbi:MAG: carbonic anhydrase family protein [Burkholderiales bacterium]|nr:carbonic anhydrase family protein [Burkholderiales bacterium]
MHASVPASASAKSEAAASQHGEAKTAPETKPVAESKPAVKFEPASPKASASVSASASAHASGSAKAKAKATDEDELDAEQIAARISKKLEELRKQRLANFSKAPKKKKVSHKSTKDAHAGKVHNHWGYAGEEGPEHWGKLNPAWAACETGTRQSPIDIREGIRVELERISFDYKSTRFNVLDNGHTIQVNMGVGNAITLSGRTYELVQFHFHRPSEERINGKSFPMVAHFVHKDAQNRLAVVALLIDEGANNDVVQTVWNNLPLEKNDPLIAQVALDIEKILPARRDYYTYMGSLTTPPCSEGVLWLVMKEPIQMSAAQMAIFSRLYPMNARPIQNVSGRMIKESN